MNKFLKVYVLVLYCILCFNAFSQEPGNRDPATGDQGNAALQPAPPNFDKPRAGIEHGRIDSVSYPSATVGNKRRMIIYTPPGYTREKNYPVLYLLHGIGGDEKEWLLQGHPEVILDNLYADGKIVPMIVVMPNGRAMRDDRAVGD